jgi:hypothetical protein
VGELNLQLGELWYNRKGFWVFCGSNQSWFNLALDSAQHDGVRISIPRAA